MDIWNFFKTMFANAPASSKARNSAPSKYHGKNCAEISTELYKTGKGDMAAGITAEKEKAFWQGVNVGKKMK